MIPLTTLYDYYIDRPKLTEQKKPIWVYSSSRTKVGRNKKSGDTTKIWWLQEHLDMNTQKSGKRTKIW